MSGRDSPSSNQSGNLLSGAPWILTAARLPPISTWVAVYGPHRVVQPVGATFVRSDEHARYIAATCTHWMPLTLPEGESNA